MCSVRNAEYHEKEKKKKVAIDTYHEIQKNTPDIMHDYTPGSLYWLTSPSAQAAPGKNPRPTANDKKDKEFLSDDVQKYDSRGVERWLE